MKDIHGVTMGPHRMEEIFQKIIANHFSDVAGLTVEASIPVSGSLINEIIAAILQGNKTIDSCQVSIHEQNRASVRLKTGLLPWALHLKLKLDTSVDFASFSSPKMRMWLENNRMLGNLASSLHALPEWIKLFGNQVVIDLGFFLQTSAQKRFLDLVKSVEIRTGADKMIFDIRIRVDPEPS
jgi:hypothetical protein